jgi:hypothetical protein
LLLLLIDLCPPLSLSLLLLLIDLSTVDRSLLLLPVLLLSIDLTLADAVDQSLCCR